MLRSGNICMRANLFNHHQFRTVLVVASAAAAFAVIFSLFQPLAYRATMRVLIVQATSPTLDAYTAAKSAEKVGKNLAQVIESASFREAVLQQDAAIDGETFSGDERRRRRRWQRNVEASIAPESGVMTFSVYHVIPAQAEAIVAAMGAVMIRDIHSYTGSQDLDVKIIDPPVVSRFPVRPNIFMSGLIGFFIGGLLGAARVYLARGKQ
jgi:capsular polysaccharide biosynthesis protein